MADHMPDVGELVRQLGTSPPFRLQDVARGFLGAVEKVEAVNLLLVVTAKTMQPTTVSVWLRPPDEVSKAHPPHWDY